MENASKKNALKSTSGFASWAAKILARFKPQREEATPQESALPPHYINKLNDLLRAGGKAAVAQFCQHLDGATPENAGVYDFKEHQTVPSPGHCEISALGQRITGLEIEENTAIYMCWGVRHADQATFGRLAIGLDHTDEAVELDDDERGDNNLERISSANLNTLIGIAVEPVLARDPTQFAQIEQAAEKYQEYLDIYGYKGELPVGKAAECFRDFAQLVQAALPTAGETANSPQAAQPAAVLPVEQVLAGVLAGSIRHANYNALRMMVVGAALHNVIRQHWQGPRLMTILNRHVDEQLFTLLRQPGTESQHVERLLTLLEHTDPAFLQAQVVKPSRSSLGLRIDVPSLTWVNGQLSAVEVHELRNVPQQSSLRSLPKVVLPLPAPIPVILSEDEEEYDEDGYDMVPYWDDDGNVTIDYVKRSERIAPGTTSQDESQTAQQEPAAKKEGKKNKSEPFRWKKRR